MTDIDFPAGLPFLRTDYNIQHVSPFARTDMATGRARQRRVFTSVPSQVDVSTGLYTALQAQLFEAWFAYDIHDGADWFNATIKTPMGLRPYECRFIEMYKGPKLGGVDRWQFELKLEIIERPILTANWYTYGMEYVMDATVLDIALNQEWPQ